MESASFSTQLSETALRELLAKHQFDEDTLQILEVKSLY